ncbi:MAG: toll/interleukin-1 receptor domain-containing protein [Rhodomicrobium sp.]|nr:toll/interleukin-1 receptor domain-containing protein [Rhodomicrobium sp.]
MPQRIFISYRRSDTQQAAGRLYDRLAEQFGRDEVFRDIDQIAPGIDFSEHINDRLKRCEVLLALIGDRWLSAQKSSWLFRTSRLKDPDDWVRQEIEIAMRRGISIIPVLIDDAMMPGAADLPMSLKPFASKNAIRLRDKNFGFDYGKLSEIVSDKLGLARSAAPSAPASGFSLEDARLGVNLGYQLGKLEVFVGVSFRPGFAFANDEIPSIKHSIEILLTLADVKVRSIDAAPNDLTSDILRIVSVKNLKLHAAIHAGIAIFRIALARGSQTEEQRLDLEQTARNGFDYVDSGAVPDKSALFEALLTSDCSINSGVQILLPFLR